jgi:hypothetical protein
LFGLLLLTIEPRPLFIWRWCSAFSLLVTVPFAVLSRKRQVELGPSVIAEMGSFRYVYYFFGAIGGVVVLLQIYNAAVTGVFFLFYAAIVFPLAIGAIQFARMILLPSTRNETDRR